MAGAAPPEDLWVVMAHSLLGSVHAIRLAAELLEKHGHRLDAQSRAEALRVVQQQSVHLAESLRDIVELGNPELVMALDELRRGTDGDGSGIDGDGSG